MEPTLDVHLVGTLVVEWAERLAPSRACCLAVLTEHYLVLKLVEMWGQSKVGQMEPKSDEHLVETLVVAWVEMLVLRMAYY